MPSPSLSQDKRRLTSGRIPPRVLISYTGASPGTQQWVEGLYEFLSRNGINARLDTHSLRLGMDVVQYIPIVRSRDPAAGLPGYLRTKLVLYWPPGQAEDELRRRLLAEILHD